MAEITGNEILARCLKAQGVKDAFFIMGGPMLDAEMCCIKEGIRLIDTRHEQGAAYMAQAYSRVTQGPGVCMAASGAGDIEFRHRPCQCPHRLLPGRRARRLLADQPVRPSGLPGDRPGQGIGRLGQIRRPRAQCEAHPAADQFRLPEGDDRQAGPGLSRFSGRRALRQGPRGPGRLELYGPADPEAAALCRAGGDQRARRCDPQRQSSRSSARAAASSGRMPGTRCAHLSRRPASRSTRPRRAAASCPTTTPIRI